jgi:hypothetical protein
MERFPRNRVGKQQVMRRPRTRQHNGLRRGPIRQLVLEALESRLLLSGTPPYTISGSVLTLAPTTQGGAATNIYVRDGSGGDLSYSLDGTEYSPILNSDGTQVTDSFLTEIDTQFTGTTYITGLTGATWSGNSQGLTLAAENSPSGSSSTPPSGSIEIELPVRMPSGAALDISANNVTTGANITARGGAVTITASGNAAIEGSLETGSGTLSISAGGNLDIGDQAPTIEVSTSGSDATMTLSGNDVTIDSSLTTQGAALTVTANDDASIEADVSTDGGALSISAANTLAIGDKVAGISVSTEAKNDIPSGDITLTASTITTAPAPAPPAGTTPAATQILAGQVVGNGFASTPGTLTITLDSIASSYLYYNASTSLTLEDVNIQAGDITVQSNAYNTYSFDPSSSTPPSTQSTGELNSSIAGDQAGTFFKSLSLEAGVAVAISSSTIEIDKDTTISAQGDLTIDSGADSTGEVNGLGLLAFVYANVTDATSDVEINSGASLSATDSVVIDSDTENEQTSEGEIEDASVNAQVPIDLVLGVSVNNSTAKLNVNQGATITAGNAVSLAADNEQDFYTWVSAGGSAKKLDLGAVVAISNTDAEAHVAGTVTTTAAAGSTPPLSTDPAPGVSVTATSDTNNDGSSLTSVTSLIGDEFFNNLRHAIQIPAASLANGATYALSPVEGGIQSLMTAGLDFLSNATAPKESSSSSPPGENASGLLNSLKNANQGSGFAGAIAVNIQSNTAHASVAPGGVVESHGTVQIESHITDPAEVSATSLFGPSTPQNENAPSSTTPTAASAAIQFGYYTNDSQAYIDDNATVDATGALSVQATTNVPYQQTFVPVDYQNPAQIAEEIVQDLGYKLDKDFGAAQAFSSWAQSGVYNGGGGSNASQNNNGIAGSVNVMIMNNTSKAYIGSAAMVNQDTSYQNASTSDVTVSAQTTLIQVHMSGSFPPIVNSLGSSTIKNLPLSSYFSKSSGLGGSIQVIVYQGDTEAYIEPGAQVYAADLNVKATTDNTVIAVAAAGAAAQQNYAVAGSIALTYIGDTTLAEIQLGTATNASGQTVATAINAHGPVDVNAEDDSIEINIGGDVGVSGNTAIGVSVAANVVSRDTEAWIGPAPGAAPATGPAPGTLSTLGSLTVNAYNTGYLANAALAGSAATGESGSTPPPSTTPDQEANYKLTLDQNLDLKIVAEAVQGTSSFGPKSSEADSGLGVAGDGSLNIALDTTKSYIQDAGSPADPTTGATANPVTAGAVTVSSDDDTILLSVSGAVSVQLGDSGNSLAGSFSANAITADTEAYLDDVTLDASSLSISASRGGFVGSFTAAGTGTSADEGIAVAGDVSVNVILPTTNAYVLDSDLTLKGDSTVSATDTAQIYAIAGAVAYGDGGGYGIAIGLDLIGAAGSQGQTEAYVENSTIDVTDGTLGLTAKVNQPSGSTDPGIVSAAGTLGISPGGGGADIAGGGLLAVNVIFRETKAFVTGSKISQVETGPSASTDQGLSASSEDDSRIVAVGLSVAVSAGTAAAAAIGYNEINDQTRSYIDSSTVSLTGGLSLTATSNATIGSADVGGAAGTGDSGATVAGSIALNVIDDTIDAHIDNGSNVTVSGAGGSTVKATDNSMIVAIAGGVAGTESSVAVGAALGYNLISNTIEAYIDDSTLDNKAGALDLSAVSEPLLIGLTVGVAIAAGSAPFALGGSITANSIVNTLDAYIADGSDVTSYGDIDITGSESSSMYVLAGGVAAGQSTVAVGAALGFNYMGGGFDPADPNDYGTTSPTQNSINVYIDDATVSTQGNLTLSTGVKPSNTSNPNVSENGQAFTASSPTFTASSQTFTASQANPANGEITFSAPDGFQQGQAVVFTATGTGSSGYQGALVSGKTYYVNVINPTTIQLDTAAPGASGAKAAALNQYDAGALTGNVITLSSPNSFQSGQAVVFTPPGTNYQGALVPGDTYYVKTLGSTTIQLYTVPPTTSGAQPVALNAYDGGKLTSNVIAFATPDGFTSGEAVVFTASGSSYGGALADGQTYYVNVLSPTTIQLYTAPLGASGSELVALNANDAGTLSTQPTLNGSGLNEQSATFAAASQTFTAPSQAFTAPSQAFTTSDVDTSNGEITFANPDGFAQGQAVTFSTLDFNYQGALVAGQTYYVNVVSSTTIQLYTELPGTSGAEPVALNASDTGTLTPNAYTDITVANADAFQQGQTVVFSSPSSDYQGALVSGQTYYVNVVNPTTIELYTESPSTPGAEAVTLNNNDAGTLTSNAWTNITFPSADNFTQGQAVVFTPPGSNYQGALVPGQTYYVNVVNPTTIQLYTEAPGTAGAQPVTLNANDSGTLTTTDWTDITFARADGFQQGEAVLFTAPSANYRGALKGGQTYYVNVVNSTTIELDTVLPSTPGAAPVTLNAYDTGALSAAPSITLPQPTSDQITNVTAAGSVAKNVAVSGSISLNFLQNDAVARISDIASKQSVTADGSITIEVNDGSEINSGTGGVAISVGQVAVGAAVSYNQIQNQFQARIGNNSTTPVSGDGGNAGKIQADGPIDIQANSTAQINNVTLAGSAAQNAAVSGSAAVNQVANTIDAYVADSSDVVGKGGVNIQAQDQSTIGSGSGQISVGFSLYSAAVGAALAYNTINNTIYAGIDASTVHGNGGDVSIEAQSQPQIISVAAGGSGAVAAGVAGSGEANLIGNTVTAEISGSTVTTDDTLTLQALSTNSLEGFGGALAVGAVGVGATVVVNQDTSQTTADITGSMVTANGDGTAASVPEWTVSGGSESETTQPVSGVAVVAYTSDPLYSVAATGAAGGTGVGANVIVDLIQTQTTADISSSTVTAAPSSSASSNPSLIVRAHQDTNVKTDGAAAAYGGAASFGAGVDVINLASQTNAYITTPPGETDSDITAGGDIDVDAETSQNIDCITAAVALGGQWTLAGSAAAVKTASATNAYISGDTTVSTTGGTLSVTANDTVQFPNDLSQLSGFAAGSLTGGGGFGLGASIAVALIEDTTQAYINGPTVTASGDVTISANTTEDLPIYVGTAGLGGSADLSGAIAYVDTATATTANITSATVSSSTGDVSVTAGDTTAITDQVGTADLAAGGELGAAIDILTSQNTVTADIGAGSTVDASSGSVTVSATATRNISSTVIAAGAAGGLSLSGAISLVDIGVGLSPPSQQSSDVSTATGLVPSSVSGIDTGSFDPNRNNTNATGNTAGKNAKKAADQAVFSVSTTIPNQTAGTEAYVADGASVTAGSGGISVQATDTLTENSLAGSGALGLFGLSFGLSLALVNIGDGTEAYVGDAATLATTGPVTIEATFTDTPTVNAYGGAAAAVGAVGGQDAEITDSSSQLASDGDSATASRGAIIQGASSVTISAMATRTLAANVGGATVAVGLGAGEAVSSAIINGSTTAFVATPTNSKLGLSAGSLSVTATSTDSATTTGWGLAAGVGLAGNGDSSTSTISPTVSASTAPDAQITTTGSGGVEIEASETPTASATTTGVTVAGGVALGVSLAKAQINPTVTASVGDNAVLAASSLNVAAQLSQASAPSQGGAAPPSDSADAIAGSGGILAGADATDAEASASGQVTASTGNEVALPDGDVTVSASDQTDQVATATGVTVGGIFALGADITDASSNVTTTATLGNDSTSSARTGALVVSATGSDENQINLTAGAGAGIATIAATSGTTNDSSQVAANVDGGTLYAGLVTVSATNNGVYSPNLSSINVAVGVSGSGANATNTEKISSDVNIGSSGTSTRIYTPGRVLITAQNQFGEDPNASGVQGGSGSVLATAAAAQDTSTLTGNSFLTLAPSVTIGSPSDPSLQPSAITMVASTLVTSFDNVSLNSGGGVTGTGVDSTLTGTLKNSVTIGNDDDLTTPGTLEAATFTKATAELNVAADTYGAAAGAGTTADINVTTTQNVTVDPGATLLSNGLLGLVELTPGSDEVDGNATTLSGDPTASSLAEGAVGVASATADADLTNNATLWIKSGAQVLSGQNITIGAYTGTLTPSPSSSITTVGVGSQGVGIGLSSPGDSSSSSNTSSTVEIDTSATVVAGYYHELDITIPPTGDSPSAGNQLSVNGGDAISLPLPSNDNDTVSPDPGAPKPFFPFTAAYETNFNPSAFIGQNFSDSAFTGDLSSVAELDETTAPSPDLVNALELGLLYASGGNVVVNADSITGAGSITANVAQIDITNNSPDYLILNTLTVPDLPGGQIDFTGTATTAPGMTLTPTPGHNAGLPSVTIDNTYDKPVGANSQFGPAIFLVGTTSNLSGSVTVDNALGSLGVANTIDSNQLTMDVYGALDIVAPGAAYNAGSDPTSDWQNLMTWPGGNPTGGTSETNAPDAVIFAANAQWASTFGTTYYNPSVPNSAFANAWSFTTALISDGGESTSANGGQTNGYQQSLDSASGTDSTYDNYSFVYFGDELPWMTGNSTFDNSTYQIADTLTAQLAVDVEQVLNNPAGDANYSTTHLHISPGQSTSEGEFPIIPAVPLSFTPTVTPSEPPSSTVSVTGLITIVAGTVNLDTTITAGQVNNYSLSLPASLLTTDSGNFTNIDKFRQTWPTLHGLNPIETLPLTTVESGDQTISATYNADTNQITIDDVYSNTIPPQVVVDGDIVNTISGSQINVASGVGNVTVDNETGIPVVIHNVDTGTNAPGIVDIINTDPKLSVSSDQTLYVYTPGHGTETYVGPGNDTPAQLMGTTPTAVTGINGGASSVSYSPVKGDRYEFQLQATLTRSDWNATPNPDETQAPSLNGWEWASQPDDSIGPWEFLNQDGSPSASSTGWVVNLPQDESDNLVETISSPAMQFTPPPRNFFSDAFAPDDFYVNSSDASNLSFNYTGDDGFKTPPGDSGDSPWYYIYPLDLTLDVSASVKADYPIGISFSGNDSGNLTINSDAEVVLAGSINNANGTTKIDVVPDAQTPGNAYPNIVERSSATLVTDNLNLDTTVALGETGQPITATVMGVLDAESGPDGIDLALTGSPSIGTVTAGDAQNGYGNVAISTVGSLVPQVVSGQNNSDITGDNIALVSTGSVGSASNPLMLDATPDVLPGVGTRGGIVNVTAAGVVNIDQSQGNLLVGRITTQGDVTVSAFGKILDASQEEAGAALNSAQVQSIQRELNLTTPQEVTAQNEKAFKHQVQDDYQQYWSLIDVGTPTNGVFSLTSQGLTLFAPEVEASLNLTNVTPAQEDTYANSLYQQLVSFFENQVYGADWSSLTEFQTYQPNYSYTLTAAQITALTDPGWTAAELEDTIDSISLNSASGPQIGNGRPDIIGKNVTLTSNGGGVGALEQPVTISVSDLESGHLSRTQLEAMAAATAPGEVKLEDPAGKIIAFPSAGSLPANWPTGYSLVVTVTEPFFVSATGTFSANVTGSLFVQGTDTGNTTSASLRIGQIVATANVQLTAPGGIASARTATTAIQASGSLILAANGDIGSSKTPLTIAAGGGLSATAGGAMVLDQTSGSLSINQAIAATSLNIQAPGSILAGSAPAPIQVQAPTIALVSHTGSIGKNTANLVIEAGSSKSGSLTASAKSGIDISQTKGPLVVSHVKTSGGNIVLDVPGNSTANDNLSLATGGTLNAPAGTITLNVGGNLTISSGSTVLAKSAVNLSGDFQNKSAGTGSVFDIDSAIHSPSVVISGGRQGEVVNLETTAAGSKVTINLVSGTNTINIGSSEPTRGGVLANIQGAVNVMGTRSATLNLDDSGSRARSTGTLTSTALTGFKMGKGGIAYSRLGALRILLGSRDKLTEKSKASGTTTTITGGLLSSRAAVSHARVVASTMAVDSILRDGSDSLGLTSSPSSDDLDGVARAVVKNRF